MEWNAPPKIGAQIGSNKAARLKCALFYFQLFIGEQRKVFQNNVLRAI